jgi:hypothetical protein
MNVPILQKLEIIIAGCFGQEQNTCTATTFQVMLIPKKVPEGGGDKFIQIIAGVYVRVSVCDYHKVVSW